MLQELLSVTNFESASCTFVSLDPRSATLHISLNEERKGLRVHSFAFTAKLSQALRDITVSVDNASGSQYARAWAYHQPWAKVDGIWQRADNATYVNGRLRFRVPTSGMRVEVAWYPSYDIEHVNRFLEREVARPGVSIHRSDDGHVIVSTGRRNAPTVFVIARQHPGETIGSFVLEGFIRNVLADPRALENLRFVIVPIVNLEGVLRGLHRHDTNGRDLNRSWRSIPGPDELQAVKTALRQANDLFAFVDIHGDEVTKWSFINYRIGIVDDAREKQYRRILEGLASEDPVVHVIRTQPFYKRFAKAVIRQRALIRPGAMTANEFVSRKFHTLALTIEPSVHDLTPEGAQFLGASIAHAITEVAK
jgi:hypothetical protein